MNGTDEVIESVLRTALHDAADQVAVRPKTSSADELVQRRRVKRRAPMAIAIAALLVVALVVGGSLLLSARNGRSSVRTAAGAPGGCAGKAYVVDGGDGNGDGAVYPITMATGEVSTPIPVRFSTSGGPFSAVAITPDGKHAYVTHADHDRVLVIDTASGSVSATIPVGAFDVAITPDGKHVYATSGADVSVIDTAAGVVSAKVHIGNAMTEGIAITPDGKHAYVTGAGDTVTVIDTAKGVVSARIDIGWGTTGVAITPDGKHAYVAGSGPPMGDMAHPPPGPVPGVMSIIDTAKGVVSATVPIGRVPGGVAVTPDGTHVYVADHAAGGGSVSVIDTASGVVSATIALGTNDPQIVAITPDGRYAYVTGPDEYSHLPGKEDPAPDPLPVHGTVSVIDTATGVVSATIPVGKNPGGLAICPW